MHDRAATELSFTETFCADCVGFLLSHHLRDSFRKKKRALSVHVVYAAEVIVRGQVERYNGFNVYLDRRCQFSSLNQDLDILLRQR